MLTQTKIIHNEDGMRGLAAEIAPLLKTGDVMTLVGGLGAGKTSFSRALIRSLSGREDEVPSPTFTLVQTYEMPELSVWHFDLYRLKEKEVDVLELGWDDARRFGVCLVEWPDRLGNLLPKDRLEINIEFDKTSETARKVTLTPFGGWAGRLHT